LVDGPRSITEEEIRFYRANGWVHLKALISEDQAGSILKTIQCRQMDPDSNFGRGAKNAAMWETIPYPSRQDASLTDFTRSRALGDAAADLQGRPVRYWRDEVLRKMPAHHAASAETPWHQDHPYTPFDRSGRPQFWLALAEIPPERGTMTFLSGSHRSGVLGRAFDDDSAAMRDQITSLQNEFAKSPPLHLRAGDATVHDGMTIHSARANTTSEPRWAYVIQFFVADALYTGARNPVTDNLGLEVNKPFCDERFPIVGWPRQTPTA
jgi:hypothetical protein